MSTELTKAERKALRALFLPEQSMCELTDNDYAAMANTLVGSALLFRMRMGILFDHYRESVFKIIKRLQKK